MLAIPVKTDTPDAALAPKFGKAKWFALVADDGSVSYWRNVFLGGRPVIDYLITAGVSDIIFQHMGEKPAMLFAQAGIACYHGGEGRVLFKDALQAFRNGTLAHVSPRDRDAFVSHFHHHAHGEAHHGHRH